MVFHAPVVLMNTHPDAGNVSPYESGQKLTITTVWAVALKYTYRHVFYYIQGGSRVASSSACRMVFQSTCRNAVHKAVGEAIAGQKK